MARLQPIAQRLAQRGHRIFAALKDLSRAPSIFDPKTVSFLQAPIKTTPPKDEIRPAFTFAQILHNIGFANPPELGAMTAAWRNVFQLVRPDLVLLDIRLPDGNGLSILKTMKEKDPRVVVIMMTAYGVLEDAVTALREIASQKVRFNRPVREAVEEFIVETRNAEIR